MENDINPQTLSACHLSCLPLCLSLSLALSLHHLTQHISRRVLWPASQTRSYYVIGPSPPGWAVPTEPHGVCWVSPWQSV